MLNFSTVKLTKEGLDVDMKYKAALLVSLLLLFSCPAVCAQPDISAPAAVLADAQTGLVLYQKDADAKMYPASTTKIMTAILVLEMGNMDDIITASHAAVNSISYDSSKIGLYEGEKMSVRDLFYGLILASGNDAANVLAEHVCGSIEDFVKLMNEKAAELGAENTHFVNTHGLHDEKHYTTARDLTLIASHAMSLPEFRETVSTRVYKIEPTNKFDEERTLVSTNHLLDPASQYYYKYATGIKTGYTSDSGFCLVSSAANDESEFVCVVLGAQPQEGKTMSFVDTKILLDYAFSLKRQPIAKKGDVMSSVPLDNSYSDEAFLEAASTLTVLLPEGAETSGLEKLEYIKAVIKAPIARGELLGRMEYWYDGVMVGSVNMNAVSDYAKMPAAFVLKPLYGLIGSMGIYLLLLLVIIILILVSMSVKGKKKKGAKFE